MTQSGSIDRAQFKGLLRRAVFLPLVIAFAVAAIFLWNIEELMKASSWVDHTNEVISSANEAERLLMSGGWGFRGYALTKDKKYLKPFQESVIRLPDELDSLKIMVSDSPNQMALVDRLKQDYLEWKARDDRALQLLDEGKSYANATRNGAGRVLMESMRKVFSEFVSHEANLRVERTAGVQRTVRRALWLALGLTIVLGLILGVRTRAAILRLMGIYEASLANLETRAKELHESREWFSTTLQSIGDAVIVVDRDARVSFMNVPAEKLTGWRSVNAIGKPMSEVFHIVNESTRQPAFNPVNRVLQEGVVVGLANHTVLVSTDKTEAPIEDSAAPIKDRFGNILGVVLVFRDVTEKHKANRAILESEHTLRALNVDLQKAVSVREEFLSVASHELKTPITSLKLHLQLTKRAIQPEREGATTAGKLDHTLDLCLGQIDRLTGLVEDLLDVSRMEAGRLTYDFQRVELMDIVTAAVERMSRQFQSAGSRVSISSPQKLFIEGDRARLDQIVVNLLTNAIKYGEGKPIAISVYPTDTEAIIAVEDHGIGIAPEKKVLIFERFERAIGFTNISGLGLGLYIARQIVLAHHGRIEVNSQLGIGSTFTIHLPFTQPV
jgi:PAS domain S-box-containing protein